MLLGAKKIIHRLREEADTCFQNEGERCVVIWVIGRLRENTKRCYLPPHLACKGSYAIGSSSNLACGPVHCMACTSPLLLSFFPPLDLLLFTI